MGKGQSTSREFPVSVQSDGGMALRHGSGCGTAIDEKKTVKGEGALEWGPGREISDFRAEVQGHGLG